MNLTDLDISELEGESLETCIAARPSKSGWSVRLLHVLDFVNESVGSDYIVTTYNRETNEKTRQRCGTFSSALRVFNQSVRDL